MGDATIFVPGAVAQLVRIAGLQNRRSQVRILAAPLQMAVVAYVLFFLAGLGFGYAAIGVWKWLPLAFPLLLALAAAASEGIDGTMLLRLALALLVTAIGVVLGIMRAPEEQPPARRARLAVGFAHAHS